MSLVISFDILDTWFYFYFYIYSLGKYGINVDIVTSAFKYQIWSLERNNS